MKTYAEIRAQVYGEPLPSPEPESLTIKITGGWEMTIEPGMVYGPTRKYNVHLNLQDGTKTIRTALYREELLDIVAALMYFGQNASGRP